MFADNYLIKNCRVPLIKSDFNDDFGIIIVIPCFYEPDILATLESLIKCDPAIYNTEVIVVVNHSETASEKIKNFNRKTVTALENWIAENRCTGIKIFVIGPVELRTKWAGAGLARKVGMDEAVLRFNSVGKESGIIVSLDADTLVDRNYLVEIEKHFKENPKNVGATISFEHQKSGLSIKHLEGINLYEKYLSYYKRALSFAGFPFSMFTVGSAFAVKAGAYVKRGGMNRRQAGEDFYFLQNLAQIGSIGEIISTKVYPSARLSDRVPFGTGPILQKWLNGKDDLTKTYNFQAFRDLKSFFDIKDKYFHTSETVFLKSISELPEPVKHFLEEDNFWVEIEDLNKNCSNLMSFQNRFFQKFNAFKILKFLNFAHEKFYIKDDLETQIVKLNKYETES